MIAAARDQAGVVHVTFYSLTNDTWQQVNTIVEYNFVARYDNSRYDVSISGKTAFVGFDGSERVVVYEQNGSGVWERKQELSNSEEDPDLFGKSVAIDDDLACVGSQSFIYLFHRDDGNWTQIDRVDIAGTLMDPFYDIRYYNHCSIAGRTVAVKAGSEQIQLYILNEELGKLELLQDPIDSLGTSYIQIDLTNDYLVSYSSDNGSDADGAGELTVYSRLSNQSFTFLQQLLSSDSQNIREISIDKDTLVVGGSNRTHIFSEKSEYWEETITLEEAYDGYQVSGRNLLAWASTDLYAFNTEECAQAMPTQSPSISLSPTICYSIEITVVYDYAPERTSWDLKRMGGESIISYEESNEDATSYTESICLQEGEYKFIIYDSAGEGLGNKGHYTITAMNGAILAHGGEFGFVYREASQFLLPFVPSPSALKSRSQGMTPTG